MQLGFDPADIFGTFGSGGGVIGYVILAIGLWPTLEKAGLPGWGALIPIYNVYLIFKLGGVSFLIIGFGSSTYRLPRFDRAEPGDAETLGENGA
jgi:hypothetical protein